MARPRQETAGAPNLGEFLVLVGLGVSSLVDTPWYLISQATLRRGGRRAGTLLLGAPEVAMEIVIDKSYLHGASGEAVRRLCDEHNRSFHADSLI